MDNLYSIFACLPCLAKSLKEDQDERITAHAEVLGEKTPLLSPRVKIWEEEALREAFETLLNAERGGRDLQLDLQDIVAQTGGWKEWMARAILQATIDAIECSRVMGEAMREAYEEAEMLATEMIGFIEDHPVLCMVLALGILVILAPAIIHALGFGLAGPIEGTASLKIQAMLTANDAQDLLPPRGSQYMVDVSELALFSRTCRSWE